MHYDYDYDYDNDKKQDTNSVLKISGLETNIFGLKMMVKSGLEFFIFKFY